MPHRTEDERLFTEEEVRALLSRAIAQQEAARHRHARREHGLSLQEIQSIAAEVGVDAQYVEAALADLEGGTAPVEENKFWGGPMKRSLERTVHAPLTDETMAEMAEAIRSEFAPHRGHLEVVGSAFEWTLGAESGDFVLIRAEEKAGRTTLRIQQSFVAWALLWHLLEAIPAFFGVLFLIAKQDLTAGFGALLLAAVLFFVARYFFGFSARKRTARLEQLADRLASIAADAAPAAPQAEAQGFEAHGVEDQTAAPPLLDLEDPVEQPPEGTPPRRRDATGQAR